MKSIEDIITEIEKNKIDRKKLWIEILKYPVHLDYLVDKTRPPIEINEKQISIERDKNDYLTILVMFIIIWGICFLGPSRYSNLELLLSALEFKIIPLILTIFLVGTPLYAIIGLLKPEQPLTIDKNGIQVNHKKIILFSKVNYICLANQRHQNLNGYRLKIYFKDGKEELIDINNLKWNREKIGWAIYHYIKESKTTQYRKPN